MGKSSALSKWLKVLFYQSIIPSSALFFNWKFINLFVLSLILKNKTNWVFIGSYHSILEDDESRVLFFFSLLNLSNFCRHLLVHFLLRIVFNDFEGVYLPNKSFVYSNPSSSALSDDIFQLSTHFQFLGAYFLASNTNCLSSSDQWEATHSFPTHHLWYS